MEGSSGRGAVGGGERGGGGHRGSSVLSEYASFDDAASTLYCTDQQRYLSV